MHELGTVNYIIETVEKICKEQDLKEVASVTIEIGEVSVIVPEFILDYFEWAKKKTEFMKNCTMKIETLHAVTFCQDCKKNYPTLEFGKECPFCHSGNTFLVTGNEYNIKEIEAY